MTNATLAASTTDTGAAETRPETRFPFEYLLSALLAAGLIAVAELAAQMDWVRPLVLPAPSRIALALIDGVTSGVYVEHLLSTVYSLVIGFLIGAVIAISVAGLFSAIPLLERVFTPFIVAFQSMPKVAIAPLIVIWFGFGELSKTVIVLTVCFFPIVINSLHGLKIRDRDHFELMQSLGASRWQMFFRLRLPHAAPYIFAGLHLGVIFALIGTVVAEFVGTNSGIGYLLLQAKAAFDTPAVYACLFLLMLIGLTLHGVMVQLEKRVAFWAHDISRVTA